MKNLAEHNYYIYSYAGGLMDYNEYLIKLWGVECIYFTDFNLLYKESDTIYYSDELVNSIHKIGDYCEIKLDYEKYICR